MDGNIHVSNDVRAAFHSREAASLDNSDRILEAQQYLSSIYKNVQDASANVEYLRMIDVDENVLQDMNSALSFVSSSLDHVFENIQEEEHQKNSQKEANKKEAVNRKIKAHIDYEKYLKALQTYEVGDYKRARSMFTALSRMTLDAEIKQCSIQSVNMIDSWLASKEKINER